MATDAKWDIFIAHASADAASAEELFAHLHTRAVTYLDTKSLRPGDDWDVALREAQHHSRITVVLVSKHSDTAYYQREEIAVAIQRARESPLAHRVVPVFLDGHPKAQRQTPYGLLLKHGLALSATVSLNDVADRIIELLDEVQSSEDDSSSTPSTTSRNSFTFGIDVCLCIDVCGSMSPVIPELLRNLALLGEAVRDDMRQLRKRVDRYRVRTLTFGSDVMLPALQTDFTARSEDDMFLGFADMLAAPTGPRESVWIALERAVTSPWSRDCSRSRHVVVVASNRHIEVDAAEIDHLQELWEGGWPRLEQKGKRLVLFAPAAGAWKEIMETFSQCIMFPSEASRGLASFELRELAAAIARSV